MTEVKTDADRDDAFAVRRIVFVEEQAVDPAIEYDAEDARATHFLASLDGRIVGTARVVVTDGAAKIGRMAVLADWRRRGVGRALTETALTWCRAQGIREAYLHAQTHALPFYEAMGFVAEGGIFIEADIPHRLMRRTL